MHGHIVVDAWSVSGHSVVNELPRSGQFMFYAWSCCGRIAIEEWYMCGRYVVWSIVTYGDCVANVWAIWVVIWLTSGRSVVDTCS